MEGSLLSEKILRAELETGGATCSEQTEPLRFTIGTGPTNAPMLPNLDIPNRGGSQPKHKRYVYIGIPS